MVDSKQFETKLVKVEFGKCRYNKRRENKIVVELGWKFLSGNEPWGAYFTVQGEIRNRIDTDSLCCGQCLDTILTFRKFNKRFLRIHDLWKKYHLKWRKDLPQEEVDEIDQLIEQEVAQGGRLYTWKD